MSCKGIIPGTFIVCGEGGNYCSEECRNAAYDKCGSPPMHFLKQLGPDDALTKTGSMLAEMGQVTVVEVKPKQRKGLRTSKEQRDAMRRQFARGQPPCSSCDVIDDLDDVLLELEAYKQVLLQSGLFPRAEQVHKDLVWLKEQKK